MLGNLLRMAARSTVLAVKRSGVIDEQCKREQQICVDIEIVGFGDR